VLRFGYRRRLTGRGRQRFRRLDNAAASRSRRVPRRQFPGACPPGAHCDRMRWCRRNAARHGEEGGIIATNFRNHSRAGNGPGHCVLIEDDLNDRPVSLTRSRPSPRTFRIRQVTAGSSIRSGAACESTKRRMTKYRLLLDAVGRGVGPPERPPFADEMSLVANEFNERVRQAA